MWKLRNYLDKVDRVGGFIMLPGVVMWILAMLIEVRTVALHLSAQKAQGGVAENRESTDSDSTFYYPVVEFSTPDGQRHRFISSVGSSPPSFEVGQRVPVLYRKGTPEDASIDTFGEQHGAALFWSTFGLFFILPGAIPAYFRIRKERLTEWLKTSGRAIQAEFTATPVQTDSEEHGPNPWRIRARWLNPMTNQVHEFRSENLPFDPRPFVRGNNICVWIDPHNPRRYWIDTSFLPKQAS